MYTPAHFAPPSNEALYQAIEQYSFATLVSSSASGMTASHLPLLVERTKAADGTPTHCVGAPVPATLLGHMARANPQWREAAGQQVLAIFSGPHAYISPRWYEAEKVVPTWNYVAVHAYGPLQLIEDPLQAEVLLRRTVAHYEASLPQPWTLDEPPEFVERLTAQIVAFRIPIHRLEGKWKLNQNHPAERRAKVVAALQQHEDDNSREIARLMQSGADIPVCQE
jgi:transcriptional regulator